MRYFIAVLIYGVGAFIVVQYNFHSFGTMLLFSSIISVVVTLVLHLRIHKNHIHKKHLYTNHGKVEIED